jgi:cytochrome c peroxidase
MRTTLFGVLALGAVLSGCGGPSYKWELPKGFPEPLEPAENKMSAAKVELGRHLFYEKQLSGNQTYACSSCHHQRAAFTDGNLMPIGSTGHPLPRNAMSLVNVAYEPFFMWANPTLTTLEEQILVPMFSDAPVELGMSNAVDDALARVKSDAKYPPLYAKAYPGEADPFTLANTINAMTSFVRSIVSGGSPYDRFTYGNDTTAMSDSAQRGMDLFFTEKFDCYHCHAGTTFTTAFVSKNAPTAPRDFRNTGLYNIDGNGAYPPGNVGLIEFTAFANDMGKYKIPSLRNVELTAPYFHDGSAATLDDVLDSYAHGGRLIASGPFAGDGSKSPHRDPLVKGFVFADGEKADLIEFLKSLTDSALTTDPRFSNPSCPSDFPACPGAPPSYQNEIAPLVERTCLSCHDVDKVAAARPLTDYTALFNLRTQIGNQLSDCSMPPPGGSQLTDAERATLLSWVACGAPND